MEKTYAVGVAPDAQVIVMKVFGKSGGAYDSDYMAAIEDAILLNCDVVNLSLGSGSPGFTTSQLYQDILDKLTQSDTVVSMSAGNSGSVFRDLNSLRNARLLLMEAIGGRNCYRTNVLAVRQITSHIADYVQKDG